VPRLRETHGRIRADAITTTRFDLSSVETARRA
jgi:hypothetical protein